MRTKFEDVWEDISYEMPNAKAIAFDGCHKIYVLMDNEQVHLMAGYGYGADGDGSHLITSASMNADEMLFVLQGWFNSESCPLRFIHQVSSVAEGVDPNEGFHNLIPQGYEDEFCVDCDYSGANYDGYCDECREEYEVDEEEEEDLD